MKTSPRLENALLKLYQAFHNNALNPECCKRCAVGNITDNKDFWKHFSDRHGSTELNYTGRVHELLSRRYSGYLPSELLQIEVAFLKGCGYGLPLKHNGKKPFDPTSKVTLFQGLCEAVDYLCRLEGIQNVMEYTAIFKHESPRDEPLAFAAS